MAQILSEILPGLAGSEEASAQHENRQVPAWESKTWPGFIAESQ